MKIVLTLFTPADAERIAGVSVDLQRDWRRRGYLEKQEGHARFSVFDLAQMLVLKTLSERGIGPDRAKDVAETAATEVAIAALRWSDAWDANVQLLRPESMNWGEFSDLLCSEATTEQLFSRTMRPRLSVAHDAKLIWWSDDSFRLTGSIDDALSSVSSSDPKVSGAIIIIDLAGLASRMIDAAQRPFAGAE